MYQFFLSAHYTIVFFLIAIAIEAVIEIVKDSDISHHLIHPPITNKYAENPTWYNYTLYKWITCGQCMSVIYSIPGAIYLSTYFSWYYIPLTFTCFLFALQRSTNWLNTTYKLLARGRVTAIELVSPLVKIGPDMTDYNNDFLLSEALDREFRRGSEDTVVIRTQSDIIRIIGSLKSKKPGEGKIVSVNIGESEFHVNTSTNHPSYMEMIKSALSDTINTEPPPIIEINDGEQLVPLNIGGSHTIDGFIQRCTGGKRDGHRIRWSINDAEYFYDPVVDKLTIGKSNPVKPLE